VLDDPSIIGATGCAVRRHHAPHRECLNFTRRAEQKGWKQAVEERDQGTFDWIT
jgi:hypothetical protein